MRRGRWGGARGLAGPALAAGALWWAAACGGAAPSGDGRPGGQAGTALPSWEVQHRDTTALWVGLHALDARTAWVTGHGGRVMRTMNGGARWEAVPVPGAEAMAFRDVHAFSSREAVVLAIGAGDASRIYRTGDGGSTWTETFRNEEPDAFFDCLAFWDDARGFAFSDAVDGEFVLIRTGDGGRSWSRIDPERVPDARPGEGSFAASGTCAVARAGGLGWFATGASGVDTRVVRTTDGGETWHEAVTPVPSREGDEGLTSLAFADDRLGAVFGGLTLDSAVNVAVTRDGGATWEAVAAGVLDGTVYGSSVVPGTPGPALVAVSPTGSAWSPDFGRSWTRFDTLLEHWTVDLVGPGEGWAAGRGVVSRLVPAPP